MSGLEHRALAGAWRGAATRLVLVVLIAAALLACGKKGDPKPPTDQPLTYPKVYPSE